MAKFIELHDLPFEHIINVESISSATYDNYSASITLINGYVINFGDDKAEKSYQKLKEILKTITNPNPKPKRFALRKRGNQ